MIRWDSGDGCRAGGGPCNGRLLGNPCLHEVAEALDGDALAALDFFEAFVHASDELDFTSDFVEGGFLWESVDEVENDFAVAHGGLC